jgi:hypothetical protein
MSKLFLQVFLQIKKAHKLGFLDAMEKFDA